MAQNSKNILSLSRLRGKSFREMVGEPNGSLEQFWVFEDAPDNFSVIQGMPLLQPMKRSKQSKTTVANLEKFFSKKLIQD